MSAADMASRLGQNVACDEQPWSWELAIFYGLLECRHGSTAISNACDPSMEHLSADVRLPQNRYMIRVAKYLREVRKASDSHQMDVGVDQTGENELAVAIHNLDFRTGLR